MDAYLDNSATTRPCAEVAALLQKLMTDGWYNPSALYRPAMEIQKKADQVREKCLEAAGAKDCRIVFTSGGTESDNLAILGHMRTRRQSGTVLISSVEHPAVSMCAEELRRMGHTVKEIPVEKSGSIDLNRLEEMLQPNVAMICVMQVNNETGSVEPIEEIVRLRDKHCTDAAIHVDGVQGFLRVPVQFRRLGIQSYALSGHKIHALKGTGALIVEPGHRIHPLQYGGGQEENIRSGTENTFGILSLGCAIESWDPSYCDKIRELKIRLWSEIQTLIPEASVNGADPNETDTAPHILNVAFEPVRSQTMLFALEGDGIYVSAGSACASRKQKVSPVLKAMGVPTQRADCSLRFSLSRYNTLEEINYTAERISAQYNVLKKYKRR